MHQGIGKPSNIINPNQSSNNPSVSSPNRNNNNNNNNMNVKFETKIIFHRLLNYLILKLNQSASSTATIK